VKTGVRFFVALLAFACLGLPARAHVGSPDVFYEGLIGPYHAQVTIRMPGVVPGLASIDVRVEAAEAVTVSFRPLFSGVAISNAPPPDLGVPVRGETNLYSGQLWLMAPGAYNIEVSIHGPAGEGAIPIPVNSRATRQLPLPKYLGAILAALGLLLVVGGVAIVAATTEATLEPGTAPSPAENRRRWIAGAIAAVVFLLAIVGGKKWWDYDENNFRSRLVEGGWPDIAGSVRTQGAQRILTLTIGAKDLNPNDPIKLAPDHGKLIHFFLVRLPNHDAFAHIHPVRKGNQTFEVAVPPLPEGDYEMLCDLTFDDTGLSTTATNLVHLPAAPPAFHEGPALEPDPDDSWAADATHVAVVKGGQETISRCADDRELVWKAHPDSRVNEDADLSFELHDGAGHALALEPYMGMLSHVAVLRSDGRVFAHLHPSGNFSMAAQALAFAKLDSRTNNGANDSSMAGMSMDMSMPGMDHSAMAMMHMMHHPSGATSVSLPYQFPSAGQYRLWVQVKSAGRVLTGVFDTTVE